MADPRGLFAGLLVSALVPSVAGAACVAGAEACPIVVQMKTGTDTISLVDTLRPNVDCCYFSFDAKAGQTLTWKFKGPDQRMSITTPDGKGDDGGPDLPASIPLAASGTYVLGVGGNTMSDNTYGPFRLTITIR